MPALRLLRPISTSPSDPTPCGWPVPPWGPLSCFCSLLLVFRSSSCTRAHPSARAEVQLHAEPEEKLAETAVTAGSHAGNVPKQSQEPEPASLCPSATPPGGSFQLTCTGGLHALLSLGAIVTFSQSLLVFTPRAVVGTREGKFCAQKEGQREFTLTPYGGFRERRQQRVGADEEGRSKEKSTESCFPSPHRLPGTFWLTGAGVRGGFSSLRVILVLGVGILSLLDPRQEVGFGNGGVCV